MGAATQPAQALNSDKDKQSYAMGMSLANQLKKQSVVLDADMFMQGLKAVFSGGKTLMTDGEALTVIANLQSELKKRKAGQTALLDEARSKNKQDGEAFLVENKAKEGVVTLESGLQYKILKAGDGKKPALDDTVICNYRGTLIDGKEFDSSYKRNKPATFAVSKVIKGWTEVLQLMPAGSTWQLFVPPDLAYGERGAGRNTGPDATLVFEVELVAVKDPSGSDPRASGEQDSVTQDAAPATRGARSPRRGRRAG